MLDADDGKRVGRRSVVFVCEGNTCRSPLAEVIAGQMFAAGDSCFFSAGLTAVAGDPAAEPTRLTATALGLDLSGHRARPLAAVPLAEVLWVIAMTRSQAARLRAAGVGRAGVRIGVLGAPGLDLADGTPTPACEEVADPWGADLDTYRGTAEQIRRLLEAWTPFLAGACAPEGN